MNAAYSLTGVAGFDLILVVQRLVEITWYELGKAFLFEVLLPN